jgi:hypothetical protein
VCGGVQGKGCVWVCGCVGGCVSGCVAASMWVWTRLHMLGEEEDAHVIIAWVPWTSVLLSSWLFP